MRFLTSQAFIKGDTHRVCEDYALSSTISGLDLSVQSNPLIIVSDGCSSMPDTDVGARLVALTAKKIFEPLIASRMHPAPQVVGAMLCESILKAAEAVGTPKDSCAATLLAGFVLDGLCHVYAFGDGYWYRLDRDGNLSYTIIECPDNNPPYLIYRDDEAGRAQQVQIHSIPEDTVVILNQQQFHWSFPVDDISEFGVATDGIGAVKYRVAGDVLATLTGDRIDYQIERFLLSRPVLYDDIGIAAIRVEHPLAPAPTFGGVDAKVALP